MTLTAPVRGACQPCVRGHICNSLRLQQLERMCPLTVEEAWYAPKHAKRLDSGGCLHTAHVRHLPPKCSQNPAYRFLFRLVVPAYEHRWPATLELGVHHRGCPNRIEGLDELGIRELFLQLLHEGVVAIGEELQHAMNGRRILNGIGRIDDGFSRRVLRAGQPKRVGCHLALDRKNDYLRGCSGCIKCADRSFRVPRLPLGQFLWRSRPHRDFVAMLQETAAQYLRYIA